jgi:hypothetical protein
MASHPCVVVLLLALLGACSPQYRVRLDTGHGSPREHAPRAPPLAVRVSTDAFEEALSQWVLTLPLSLRTPRPGGWVRASYPGRGEDTPRQRWMRRSFGGLCAPSPRGEGCLSLRDDVTGLNPWDKLGIALGLSLEPMRESIARAVEDTLAPQLFYTVIATGLVSWAILAANPEPVFTKTAAVVSALLLAYLGIETFLELVDASQELKRATDSATSILELARAGQRFGHRVGPAAARVFVLAVTVGVSQGMTGGAAWLSSRLTMLPRFPEAAAGASVWGLDLASVGQVRAVSVAGNTLILSLPATALAMTASKSWGSFSGLKGALGTAGEGKQWHHIVEQTPGNAERFGRHALHNTENVIPLDTAVHQNVSRLYSSIRPGITNSRTLTVRQWLSAQSYDAQRAFGLNAIAQVRNGVWP